MPPNKVGSTWYELTPLTQFCITKLHSIGWLWILWKPTPTISTYNIPTIHMIMQTYAIKVIVNLFIRRWHSEAWVSESMWQCKYKSWYWFDWPVRASSEIHSHTRLYLKYKKFYFALKKFFMNYSWGFPKYWGPLAATQSAPPPLNPPLVLTIPIVVKHFISPTPLSR